MREKLTSLFFQNVYKKYRTHDTETNQSVSDRQISNAQLACECECKRKKHAEATANRLDNLTCAHTQPPAYDAGERARVCVFLCRPWQRQRCARIKINKSKSKTYICKQN